MYAIRSYYEIVIPIAQKFAVAEKGSAPPRPFNSPFGRYAYRLKLELTASEHPQDCRIKAIAFQTIA